MSAGFDRLTEAMRQLLKVMWEDRWSLGAFFVVTYLGFLAAFLTDLITS